MAVDYGKTLGKAINFAIKPHRWLQFFVVDFIFAMMALAALIAFLPNFSFIQLLEPTGQILWLLSLGIYFLIIALVWVLVRIWVMTAMVHQTYREKEMDKSWGVANKKYFSVLGALIIVMFISFIINLIGLIRFIGPVIMLILLFIVSWSIFFYLQAIVIKNLGFVDALKESYEIFKRKALTVIAIWLILAIISAIIFGIFSIPLLILIFAYIIQFASGTQISIYSMAPGLIATGLIALIGLAISNVFMLKAQTEFYLQLKKKRFGLF